MVGIYKITSPTNKVYIGQSWDIMARKGVYKSMKCQGQTKLYSSFIKHGWKAHMFEIIHHLPEDINQTVLDNYEILYFELYKDSGHTMMNVREPGRGGKLSEQTKKILSLVNTGKKYSEETNKKKSRPGNLNGMYGKVSPLKGKKVSIDTVNKTKLYWTEERKGERAAKYSMEYNPNSKKVDQYTKEGTFIKSWPCIKSAEIQFNISHIGCVCKGLRKYAGGFIWKYSN